MSLLGYRIDSKGYKLIRVPKHPNAHSDGYIFEHRLVLAEKLGRPLNNNEKVHHINHNKLDNRIENLIILSATEHSKTEKPWEYIKRNGETIICITCGKERYYKPYRIKRAIKHFCSDKCYQAFRRSS